MHPSAPGSLAAECVLLAAQLAAREKRSPTQGSATVLHGIAQLHGELTGLAAELRELSDAVEGAKARLAWPSELGAGENRSSGGPEVVGSEPRTPIHHEAASKRRR
jgi:hypothetical protein